jgi:hypothetical protein
MSTYNNYNEMAKKIVDSIIEKSKLYYGKAYINNIPEYNRNIKSRKKNSV